MALDNRNTLLVTVACTASGTPPPAAEPPGSPLPLAVKDFELAAYQGEVLQGGAKVAFSKIFEQQKPVVLNFWAGQCPPCVVEMPHFQKVADEYAGKVIFLGLDVGVSTGLGTSDDARKLLSELQIRYPAAYALDQSPLELYGVRSMPNTVFLSARGEVVSQTRGAVSEDQLRESVQNLMRT